MCKATIHFRVKTDLKATGITIYMSYIFIKKKKLLAVSLYIQRFIFILKNYGFKNIYI